MTEEVVLRAARFAADAHRDFTTDSGLPYITHVSEVALHLRRLGGITDTVMLAAAFLHDTLEHSSVSRADLLAAFGPEVTALVEELTRQEPDAAQVKALKKGQIAHLRFAMMLGGVRLMSPRAMTIKLADRLANLGEARITKVGKKRERYIQQTRALLEAIPRSVNPELWLAVQKSLQKWERKSRQ